MRYKINGEKWYLTIDYVADFLLIHTHFDIDQDKVYCIFVEKDAPMVRGYMRKNVVERLWREQSIDRVWKCTSEIQCNVIGGYNFTTHFLCKILII